MGTYCYVFSAPTVGIEESIDMVTVDFVHVRWLGDRKAIEAETTTWGKTVIDEAKT